MYVCVCVRVSVTTRSAAELEGKNVCFVASPSNPRVVPSNEKSTIRFDFCYYRIAFPAIEYSRHKRFLRRPNLLDDRTNLYPNTF